MLHIQNIQNQRSSSYSSSCFLIFGKLDKTFELIQMSLKNIIKSQYSLTFLLFSLLYPWQLQAASNVTNNRINFRVADQTREVREQAFQLGLEKMFIRISGDRSVMKSIENPKSQLYVQQFSYEPLLEPVFDAKGELLTQRIKIRYNTELIERYLRQNALIVEDSNKNETRTIVHIEIEAVNSMKKYNLVERYLTQLREVESINPLQTDDDKAIFEIVLRSSEDAFLSAINKHGRLLKVKIEKVVEQADSLQLNNSRVVVLNEVGNQNSVQNNDTKFDRQPVISTSQPQSDIAPFPTPVVEVNQTPVYQYRFVR